MDLFAIAVSVLVVAFSLGCLFYNSGNGSPSAFSPHLRQRSRHRDMAVNTSEGRPISRRGIGAPSPRQDPFKIRTMITDNTVTLYGWPSVGGVITLHDVTAVDCTFLDLDTVNIPLYRSQNPSTEDAFCQRLLRLGATWWDSYERYQFAMDLSLYREAAEMDIKLGRRPELTTREHRWVKIAWPSDDFGLWILDCDTDWYPGVSEDPEIPSGAGKILLAKNMDERCEILKSLGATFYESVDSYRGPAFLNAWGQKQMGEIGELVQTWPKDSA